MSDRGRTAACLAVGTELLGGSKLDRNSLTITRKVERYGIRVVEKRVVGDDVDTIARAVRELVERHDLVTVTGGLGPTADDVTREAVARALGRDIRHSDEVEAWIRERYADQGRQNPKIAASMARVVDGGRPLRNRRGAAPGMLFDLRGRLLAVFPGVPWELEEMLERDLLPELEAWNTGICRLSRTLLLGGIYESDAEERIGHLYDRFGRDKVSILASYGVLRLVLTAEGEEASARRHLEVMERAFREALGDDVAGVDVSGLPGVVLSELRRAGATLATAESCTGGLGGARLTEVP
ncbi:MAG TPA: molybdopterin-binding protein, partial [Methylomirabilota bacterium]|nr:molybdopterin-binding protein [Methylomirabilota bacterium]